MFEELLPAEVFSSDDVLAAGGGDEDAAAVDGVLDRGHFVAFHGGLFN